MLLMLARTKMAPSRISMIARATFEECGYKSRILNFSSNCVHFQHGIVANAAKGHGRPILTLLAKTVTIWDVGVVYQRFNDYQYLRCPSSAS